MNCPQCSRQIPDASKFCPECGHPLSSVSVLSSAEKDKVNLLQSYIPPELAKRILSAGKQIESERRLVTILFADVTGFTAMSEKLDPEVVTTILNNCFKGLISIVYKYEGVIDKFIGDEIMAIFGAPIAHENDAERAVRCAMEMQEYIARFNALSPVALPVPLGLHSGLNTGMVVAGNVGSDLRMNYSVIGDTVNLASRLVHVAEKGKVVISDETYRAVSSLVNVEKPKTVEVKGKSEPVKTYEVLSVKSEVEPGTRVLRESQIVGRESEIEVLKVACDRLVGKSEQRIFIRGEAGVGKTRLKLELIRLAKDAEVTTYEGKCSSFELNTPYYLWTTLLKSILTLGPDAGESETRKHLHDILQILSLEKHEPYLATLLSLRYEEILMEEDQERKRRIYEGVKELVRALAERRLSIFLLEDVHWIDRFSQELLGYLFAGEELAPAIFVPIFRDEYTHWKELMARGGELIDLNRLSIADASKMMCLRLATDNVPGNLADVIYRRSEGNPFFIEELIKTLLDKKLVSVKKRKLEIVQTDFENVLPGTVQGVIMARIDRLEERLKEVLFGASVIGREFNTQLLKEILKQAEMVDSSLRDLISLELVLEQEEAKEFAYLFKHYLIQEVAYNTILQKKRKELHGLIAKAIEKLYADKLKEFYELLAFHYEKAEVWEKAADYLSRSGNKMREFYTKEESRDFTERTNVVKAKLAEGKGVKNRALIFYRLVFGLFVLGWFVEGTAFIYSALASLQSHRMSEIVAQGLLGLFFVVFAVWGGLVMFQVLRARPKAFELFEDHVDIIFNDGSSQTLDFAAIQIVHLFEHQKRPWKILLGEEMALPYRLGLMKNRERIGPPSFGFGSKKGEIHARRRTGLAFGSSMGRPWKYTFANQRDISLTPSNPEEFYEQLVIAFEKWRIAQSTARGNLKPLSYWKMPKALAASRSALITGEEPLFMVKPVFSFLPVLATLNAGWYGIAIILPLFLVLSIVTGVQMELEYRHYFNFFWYVFLAAIMTFLFLSPFFVRKRMARNNVYEFFEDRMRLTCMGGEFGPREVSYANVIKAESFTTVLCRVFNIGSVVISTNTITGINEPTGLAETMVIIPALHESSKIAGRVNELVEAFKRRKDL